MSRKIKLVAITPYFSNSGSEIALLNLLNAISSTYNVSVYTPNEHPSLKEELDTAATFIKPFKYTFLVNRVNLLFKKFNFRKLNQPLETFIKRKQYDIILLNTLVSVPVYDTFNSKNYKTILYIHETELVLTYLTLSQLAIIIDKIDLIICSSNYVMSYLKTLGRTKNIELLYPSIDYEKIILPIKRENIQKQYGLTEQHFVWGMSGGVTINKNPKMFIQIAKNLYAHNNDVKFMWIGASPDSPYLRYLKAVIKKEKLDKTVFFIEKQTEKYYEFFNLFNGFVLTSFSESFSLVTNEAQCFNIPIVTFPNGGVNEAASCSNLHITKNFSVEEISTKMKSIMEDNSMKNSCEKQEYKFNDTKTISQTFMIYLHKYFEFERFG